MDTVDAVRLGNLGGAVEFRLLGPVEVSVDEHLVDTGRPHQRTVLAALLVDARRHVSTETLIDRVWGEDPPPRARGSLHAHLTRIRRLLERNGSPPSPLVYRAGGYLLDIDPQAVDLHRFRRLVAQARGADGTGNDRVQRLRDALRLWRGEPLAGLPGEWAVRIRQSWSQEQLDATIAWAKAELDTGNAEVTVGPLTSLFAEHPLLEPLVAALLRALHETGRSAVALEHYEALRRGLADRLGTAPSAPVQAVYQAILRSDANPAPAAEPEPSPKARRALPADVAGFVGRRAELHHLLAAVNDASATEFPAVAIHAVDGMAGIGKTALAVHAAHHLAGRYPDGQRFVDLRAHSPGQKAVDPAAALETLLQADGIAAQHIPAGLDARAALWRERMADKKLLLVLDDAADTNHVLPLLPAAGGCLVLITSRRKLGTLPGAILLSLDILPPADAVVLFANRAGPRANRDEAAVHRIVQLCGYLPLAITLTAARLHTHPAWTVADLANDLTRTRDRLAELASGELAVAAAFDLSYRDLPPDLRRLFRRLALHPGPDFDPYAAAALDQSSVPEARRRLETLLEHNLITEPHRGRYRFHDLIAEHARTHAAADPEPERSAALGRLLTYYQRTANLAAAAHNAGPTSFRLATEDGTAPDDPTPVEVPGIDNPQQATDWFIAEQANLAAATTHAHARRHPAAIAIPAAMHEHLNAYGPWDLAIRLHETALSATEHTGDRVAQANALINLALIQRLAADYHAATAAAEQAHTLHQQSGDRNGQANALNALALVAYGRGDILAARKTAEQARILHQQIGNRHGQAIALDALARVHSITGDFTAGRVAAEQSRLLFQQVGDRQGEASILCVSANLLRLTGDLQAAAVVAEEAYALNQQFGDPRGRSNAYGILALVRHASGDHAAAAIAAEQAHALNQQIGDRNGRSTALYILALARHATGDHAAAAAIAEQSCTLNQRSGDHHALANALQILGMARHATGGYPAAAASFEQALNLFREVGDPDGEAEALNHIGQLELEAVAPASAHRYFTLARNIARRIGTPIHEARALEGIGQCLLRQGHPDATQHLREALAIYRQINSPDTERVAEAILRESATR